MPERRAMVCAKNRNRDTEMKNTNKTTMGTRAFICVGVIAVVLFFLSMLIPASVFGIFGGWG